MIEPITIVLPWPSSDLSPNARHMWKKIAAAKDARALGKYSIMEQCTYHIPPFSKDARLKMTFIFHPPTHRYYDLDGLVTRCKNFQDGIFDAIGNNDSQIYAIEARKKDVIKGGMVMIIIGEDCE